MAERIGDLTNAWSPDDADILDTLREADVGQLRLLYDSSNYVFLAELEHPEHGTGLGVYKPQRGERPLSDFTYGTLHRREVATYELSRLLGWPMVPPTVERDGPEGLGSIQLFIEHDPAEHFFALRDREDLYEQFMRMAAFDLVANNADRKGGHILLDARGRVWGIDQALCFHHHEKLRTVIWDFAGAELREGWRADLERAHDAMRDRDASSEPLRAFLTDVEVDAFVERTAQLLASRVLPEMYPWRCVPWPMI